MHVECSSCHQVQLGRLDYPSDLSVWKKWILNSLCHVVAEILPNLPLLAGNSPIDTVSSGLGSQIGMQMGKEFLYNLIASYMLFVEIPSNLSILTQLMITACSDRDLTFRYWKDREGVGAAPCLSHASWKYGMSIFKRSTYKDCIAQQLDSLTLGPPDK